MVIIFPISSTLMDFCSLSLLKNKDRYGYSFTQKIQQYMNISESTIYPVLRRLEKDELLITYNKPYQGRNRKYYQITDKGLKQLEIYRKEWIEYKVMIDNLTNESVDSLEEE